MCLQRSLCVYNDLYVYTKISMCIKWSLCVFNNLNVYTTIFMWIQRLLCVFNNLYVYTTIFMCIQHSLCVYNNLYVYTTILMISTVAICWLKKCEDISGLSLWHHFHEAAGGWQVTVRTVIWSLVSFHKSVKICLLKKYDLCRTVWKGVNGSTVSTRGGEITSRVQTHV